MPMKLALERGPISLLEIETKLRQTSESCLLLLSDNNNNKKLLYRSCDKYQFYRSVWKKISSMPDDSLKNLDPVPGCGGQDCEGQNMELASALNCSQGGSQNP